MWDRVIEFPQKAMALRDVRPEACLDQGELRELCEDLLGWPSRGYEVMDELGFVED